MDNMLIHPITRSQLQTALKADSHAFLLSGPSGCGKTDLAYFMAKSLLGTGGKSSQTHTVTADNNSISIDKIRELRHFLKLRTTGTRGTRRIIVIENAGLMTAEAQNALLKILEEPPEDTKLLLCADRQSQLRPTILSRLQTIEILPCTLDTTLAYFEHKGFKRADIERAYMLAEGYASICKLFLEDTEHPLTKAIAGAKSLIKDSQYARLAKVDQLAKNRQELEQLLVGLRRILSAAAARNGSELIIKKLKLVYETEKSLRQNANAKLLLTNLLLNL